MLHSVCRIAVGQFLLVKIFVFLLKQLWLIIVTAALNFKVYTYFAVSQVGVYRMLSVPVLYWHCGILTSYQ